MIHERVVQFGPQRSLVGIVTQPATGRAGGVPDFVLLNSGVIHRVGSNRLYVELARALAAHGVTTLRFDLSGIGDSERRSDVGSVREAIQRDVTDAVKYMTGQGAAGVVLFGLCSGAFDAFRSASAIDHVVGAFMVDMPGPFQSWRHFMHHVGARLRKSDGPTILAKLLDKSTGVLQRIIADEQPATGVDACAAPAPAPVSDGYVVGARARSTREQMAEELDELLARNVQLYFVFTAGLERNYNHESQFRGVFPDAARHEGLSHAFLQDADHAFGTRAARDGLIALVREWVVSNWLRQSDAA
ncbi:MAG TPA: alpha/beta fold hydrolase [Gemmatimonadaceae bacterium]|nr:alpha/beta fold hydrolase [Gemmatimonadaceae bacterium]